MKIEAPFFRLTLVVSLMKLFPAFFTAVFKLACSVKGNLWQRRKASLKEPDIRLGFEGSKGPTEHVCRVALGLHLGKSTRGEKEEK